jgi:nitrogen fixation protein NifB
MTAVLAPVRRPRTPLAAAEAAPALPRIAVGTGDGLHITEHFGFATEFQIWELAADGPRWLETRATEPACGADRHTDERQLMQRAVRTVADCRAVVVARIGDCALDRLSALGILAFEANETVAVAVREVAAHPALAGQAA